MYMAKSKQSFCLITKQAHRRIQDDPIYTDFQPRDTSKNSKNINFAATPSSNHIYRNLDRHHQEPIIIENTPSRANHNRECEERPIRFKEFLTNVKFEKLLFSLYILCWFLTSCHAYVFDIIWTVGLDLEHGFCSRTASYDS